MKMKYKLLTVFIIGNIIILLLCAILFRSWIPGILTLSLEALVLLSVFIANRIILSSNWFKGLHADPDHEIYPDNVWYRKHDERNYDLVNLGSNSAKYAFDYSNESVRAMNWSSGTQTLIDDYKLVRNFHSILKENGAVMITIMPFTSINKQTGLIDAFKFWKVLDYTQTDPKYYKKCWMFERLPILFGIPAIKAVVKKILGKDGKRFDKEANTNANPLSEEELKKHAADIIHSWKREFSIESLDSPLTEQNREGRKIRTEVMRNIIDFLEERGYRTVYVIPPVSGYLKEYFTKDFTETYIYSYLEQVGRDIPVLDYLGGREFEDKDLYFNSYYLNKRGAGIFTQRVIADLKEMNIL